MDSENSGNLENEDKAVPEPDQELSDTEEAVEAEQISSTIEDIKNELNTARDRNLRLMAEFDNYKRRTAKDFQNLIESANEKLMLEIVNVRENFERALKAGEAQGESASFYDGMKLIFTQFDEVLSKNGLSVFGEEGEAFDPAIHDALMKSPNADIPEDHIAQVFEHGYRLKDKVIKHARVIVSSGSEA
ncbi:MAG: nucleotide exchange factor GrpE [Chitinispirillia bacterium]|nr:nucleotide exchange factor GrpE [Chitinispirillia bacterium]